MRWRSTPRHTTAPPWSLAGRADLPAPLVLHQPFYRLGAGQLRPAGQREHEVRGDPQHVGLPAFPGELPQLGAAAVDLVPAGEVEADAVGVRVRTQVDGQLALGAEPQVQRQAHDQRLDRILDVLPGDPLAGCDQRVPGHLAHVRQVHGVDPVRHFPRTPQVLALDPCGRRVLARLQPRPGPGETRPQQPQQLSPFPQRQPGPYPDGSSRLRFCCLHKHMIERRLPLMPGAVQPTSSPRSEAEVRLPY